MSIITCERHKEMPKKGLEWTRVPLTVTGMFPTSREKNER